MEVEAVARAVDPGHECLCVVIKQRAGESWLDRCGVGPISSDQPFCSNCEDRHPESEEDPHVIEVTDIYHLQEGKWLRSLMNASTSEKDGNP